MEPSLKTSIEQLDIAFENIFHNLQAANMQVKDLFKLTTYLVGEWDSGQTERAGHFQSQRGHQPAMTLGSKRLALAEEYLRSKVEIDAWASCSE